MADSEDDLHDRSMHFYDSSLLPFRRPTRPPPTIAHLVRAADVHSAATHLTNLTRNNPSTIPQVVAAVRKYLLGTRTSTPSHAPILLHYLVLHVPYFYRYIASPSFFRALWRLQKHPSPTATTHFVRLLIAAWARDLAKNTTPRSDPAAAFWIQTYRRYKARTSFPAPPPNRSFVFVVSADHTTSPNPTYMSPEDLKASLRLIDEVIAARAHTSEPVSPSSPRRRRRSPPNSSTPTQPSSQAVVETNQQPIPPRVYARINAKVLSVLKRHDDIFGRSDPYYISPPTRIPSESCAWSIDPAKGDESSATLTLTRHSRSSTGSALSVAAVARENARRKLEENQASLSYSYLADRVTSEVDGKGFEHLGFYEPELGVEGGELKVSGPAVFTPTSFAGLEVNGGTSGSAALPSNEEVSQAIESVGDTVKLPDLGSPEGSEVGMTIGQRIFRFMARKMTAGEGSGKLVRKSVGSVC